MTTLAGCANPHVTLVLRQCCLDVRKDIEPVKRRCTPLRFCSAGRGSSTSSCEKDSLNTCACCPPNIVTTLSDKERVSVGNDSGRSGISPLPDNYTVTSSLNFVQVDTLLDAQPTVSKHWSRLKIDSKLVATRHTLLQCHRSEVSCETRLCLYVDPSESTSEGEMSVGQ